MIIRPLNYELTKARKKLPIIDSIDRNSPTGLFSPHIFGITEEEITTKSALISFGTYIMRPIVVQTFRNIDRKFISCLTTADDHYIRDGILSIIDDKYEPEPDDIIGYGPSFLYHNWHKLDMNKFEQMYGRLSNQELKKSIKTLTRDQIFKSYEYVLPLAFRTEPSTSGPLTNDWNVLYAEIIRYSNHIRNMGGAIAGANIDTRGYEIGLQKAVNELGDYIKGRFFGPHGVGRKEILSRNVDNSSRMVMIPNVWTKPKMRQNKIGMRSTGVPIAYIVRMFKETIIKFSREFINELYDRNLFPEGTYKEMLAYYDIDFLSEAIDNMTDPYFRISNFPAIKQDGDFTDIEIKLDVKSETGTYVEMFKKLTWTEFFYIVITSYARLYETRMITVTRPPVDSLQSIQPQKPYTLTLTPTLVKDVKLFDREYDDFPLITDFIKDNPQYTFDVGSRILASVIAAMNGKRLPLYTVMCA